jgi:HK97 family phage major capsid protein
MSVGVPSDGGYLVRKDWTTALLEKSRSEAVPPAALQVDRHRRRLRRPRIPLHRRIQPRGRIALGRRAGVPQLGSRAVTAKQPKIGKGELRLEEITGLCYTTGRLLRDAVALNGLLGDAFSSEFAFKIDNEIVRGTGLGAVSRLPELARARDAGGGRRPDGHDRQRRQRPQDVRPHAGPDEARARCGSSTRT